jgi:hypothetical protein
MSEPEKSGGIGDKVNEAVRWLQNRSRNEWIMFGVGVVVGVILG